MYDSNHRGEILKAYLLGYISVFSGNDKHIFTHLLSQYAPFQPQRQYPKIPRKISVSSRIYDFITEKFTTAFTGISTSCDPSQRFFFFYSSFCRCDIRSSKCEAWLICPFIFTTKGIIQVKMHALRFHRKISEIISTEA